MSFDAHSLKQLLDLANQLPNKKQSSLAPSQEQLQPSKKRHSIEIEENPEKLFQELIKASPDGEIPPHLLARLKEAEEKQLIKHTDVTPLSNTSPDKSKPPTSNHFNKNSQEEKLYSASELQQFPHSFSTFGPRYTPT